MYTWKPGNPCVQICCVSCGKDMPSRLAIRHMESCFNKFESQTSFGSMYKTKIEGYQVSQTSYTQGNL